MEVETIFNRFNIYHSPQQWSVHECLVFPKETHTIMEELDMFFTKETQQPVRTLPAIYVADVSHLSRGAGLRRAEPCPRGRRFSIQALGLQPIRSPFPSLDIEMTMDHMLFAHSFSFRGMFVPPLACQFTPSICSIHRRWMPWPLARGLLYITIYIKDSSKSLRPQTNICNPEKSPNRVTGASFHSRRAAAPACMAPGAEGVWRPGFWPTDLQRQGRRTWGHGGDDMGVAYSLATVSSSGELVHSTVSCLIGMFVCLLDSWLVS